jgi:glycosyltransferase involved in cell wall biosynthesis
MVVPNRESQGLSGARNTGVAVANGDLIAFLDDDAVADPDWLAALLRAFDDPGVVGAGGSATPDWSAERPSWFPEEFDWVIGCSYRGLPERTASVRNVLGCNMAFRGDVFATLGGFRSDFGRVGTTPIGAEETEFCIRVTNHDASWRVVYVPTARVQHHVPAVRATCRYFLRRCYGEGLSKAHLRRVAGVRRGLASEGQYATRTLPSGMGHLLRRGRVRKATMIAVGFSATAAGFVAGTLHRSGGQPHGIVAT